MGDGISYSSATDLSPDSELTVPEGLNDEPRGW